jgi:predicted RNA-binding protein with TRAM domain
VRVDVEDTVLRHEGGQPVEGFVVTAYKAAA